MDNSRMPVGLKRAGLRSRLYTQQTQDGDESNTGTGTTTSSSLAIPRVCTWTPTSCRLSLCCMFAMDPTPTDHHTRMVHCRRRIHSRNTWLCVRLSGARLDRRLIRTDRLNAMSIVSNRSVPKHVTIMFTSKEPWTKHHPFA